MGISLWKSAFFFLAVTLFSAYLYPTHRELGLFYTASRAFDEARFYLEKQFHRDPGDVLNARRYLETLLFEGSYELFERTGKRLLKLSPDKFFIHETMARFYADSMREEQASRHWRECLRLRPRYPEIRERLMSYYILNKDQEGLIQLYEEERAGGIAHPDDYLELTRLYVLKRRVREAEAVYLDWIERFPQMVEPKTRLAELYEYTGRPEEALRHYREAAEADLSSAELALQWMEKLILYRKEKEALEALGTYLYRFPEDKRFLEMFSDVSVRYGNREESIRYLTDLYVKFPEHHRILKSLSEIHHEMGDYARAKMTLEKYHAKTGGDYRSHHLLGDVLAELGDAAGSRREYQTALRLVRRPDGSDADPED